METRSPIQRANFEGKRYPHDKQLAETVRSTILLQWSLSFEEMLEQVHFSCRSLCRKVTKYDIHIWWLTVSVYELFECPTYLCRETAERKISIMQTLTSLVWQIAAAEIHTSFLRVTYITSFSAMITLEVLRHTRHKVGHFRDVLPSRTSR